ncbi:MAG: hypothetical protein JNK12_18975 [Acidimicrobiales bacterium]|nr:hypothetical protein [Acidimicrobiales bacterium]
MAEPVTVVWWTADAPLFESRVHPGPEEGFVAVYPLRPASDQRATLVAVVDRAVLPTARGMTIGNQDGTTVTMAPLGEPEVLDVSTAADPRTRTPPWDLMPRDRWVVAPPSTAFTRFFDRRSPTGQVVIRILAVVAGLAGVYFSVLIRPGRDSRQALEAVALLVGLGLLTAMMGSLADRFRGRDEDVHERVTLPGPDRRRLARRAPR